MKRLVGVVLIAGMLAVTLSACDSPSGVDDLTPAFATTSDAVLIAEITSHSGSRGGSPLARTPVAALMCLGYVEDFPLLGEPARCGVDPNVEASPLYPGQVVVRDFTAGDPGFADVVGHITNGVDEGLTPHTALFDASGLITAGGVGGRSPESLWLDGLQVGQVDLEGFNIELIRLVVTSLLFTSVARTDGGVDVDLSTDIMWQFWDGLPSSSGGGQRSDVDDFLGYSSPLSKSVSLPVGTSSFVMVISYGPTIDPSSFQATLSGVPFTGFTPTPNTTEAVAVPLSAGTNVLVLGIDGIRSDGRAATDRDRLTFKVEQGIDNGTVVVATPDSARIEFDQTQDYTATVTDTTGTPLVGVTVDWQISDPGVATLFPLSGITDAAGQHTTTATPVGTFDTPTVVTATAQGVGGSAVLLVVPSGSNTFQSVSAGGDHTCGLTAAGAGYCWGRDISGQLGDGPPNVESNVPVAVAGGLTFQSVRGGTAEGCGLTTTGAAYCWGWNFYGQLGDGTQTSSNVPVAVSGGLTFQSVSIGSGQVCALTTTGSAYCWGEGEAGTLGDGTHTNSSVPLAVSGGLTFQSVSTGGSSCGLTTVGAAYCWGTNTYGQIGDGTQSGLRFVPVPVVGGLTFQSLSVGGGHVCGLTSSGAAYCWGTNFEGQLGDGTFTNSGVPVAVSGGLTFQSLSLGGSSCGLTTAGAVYCWGENDAFQLGDGTQTSSNVPVAVSGGLTFQSVSTGGRHSCGLATDGNVYCWGHGTHGQLGNGTDATSGVPLAVLRPS